MGGFPTLKTQKLWSPSFSAMFLVCRTSQDDSKVSAAGRRGLPLPLTFAPSLECSRRFSVENDFVLCSVFRVYMEWLDFTDRGLKRHLWNVQREDIFQNVLIELFYNWNVWRNLWRETNSNSVEDLWLNLNKCLSRWWLVSSVRAAVCQFSDDWFHVSSSLCSEHLGTSGSHLAFAVELLTNNWWSCTITEAPTRAFSWLKAPTTTFTFKTLLRHYA